MAVGIKRVGMSAVVLAVASVMVSMGAGSAQAESPTWVNQYIKAYGSASECNTASNAANAAAGLPIDDQYYYCGGSSGNVEWLRKLAS